MSTQESNDGQSKYLEDRVVELEIIVEEQKNLLVEKENRLEEKDKRLEGKNKQVEEKNKQLEEKDKQLEEKDQKLEEKDKQLEEKDKRLKEKDDFIIKLLRELCDTRKVMKYRACNSDCVTACLVWIYDEVEGFVPCSFHLLENIRAKHKKISSNSAHAPRTDLLKWLYELKIVHLCKAFNYSKNSVDDVWNTIMNIKFDEDKKNYMLLLGRIFEVYPALEGHCVASNLKTKSGGKIQICDPQKSSVPRTMDLEQFKHYVENDKGIFLGLIDFEKLLEIENTEGCSETSNFTLDLSKLLRDAHIKEM